MKIVKENKSKKGKKGKEKVNNKDIRETDLNTINGIEIKSSESE